MTRRSVHVRKRVQPSLSVIRHRSSVLVGVVMGVAVAIFGFGRSLYGNP